MKKVYKVSRQIYNKRFFDPSSTVDLEAAREFLKHGQWPKGCPFVVDWPYTNMPDLIKTEIVNHYLDRIIAEKNSKIARIKK